MHDILLAKQIIDEISKIAKARKLDSIKLVNLEIGSVALAHGNLPEHIDEIDPGNLKFILENMSSKYGLDKVHPVRNSGGRYKSNKVLSNSKSPKEKKQDIFSNRAKFDIKKIPGDNWKILEIITN